MNSPNLVEIKYPSPKKRIRSFYEFFTIYSSVFLIAAAIWAINPYSNIGFVACLWILVLAPFVIARYDRFEPVAIYFVVFIIAFTIKPLLNEYLSSINENYLFSLSGYEGAYDIGFPFAVLFILIHIYFVHTIYFYLTKNNRKLFFLQLHQSRYQTTPSPPNEMYLWKQTAFVAISIYVPAFLYFIIVIQGLDFSAYSANRNEILRGQGLAWLLATLGTPLSIIFFYIFLLQRTIQKRGNLYLLIAMLCVISGQFIAPGRGNILAILVACIIIYWQKGGMVSFSNLFALGVGFVAFSFIILHLREGNSIIDSDSTLFFIGQDLGMFDYYVIYVGQLLSNDLSLSYGAQLLRNLYVLIPRVLLPSKPIYYSTLEIQDVIQLIPLETSQVSSTPFVEWLFNFGIFGIFMGSVLLAVTLSGFFRLLNTRGVDIRLIAYVLIFPAFVVGYVKGGFSLAFQFFLLSPAWLIVVIYFGVRNIRVFPKHRADRIGLPISEKILARQDPRRD
jgi:oligosaccharide repeat unit polymerase